jgi:hypothetical protein
VYKQRVKHLLYEQQNGATLLRTEGQIALKTHEDEDRVRGVARGSPWRHH